jgi:hypothetical protein
VIRDYIKQGKLFWEIFKGGLWVALGMGVFYQFVWKDVPEIKSQVTRIAASVEATAKDQQSALKSHAADEQQQRERVAQKLNEAVAHLLSLKSKVEGTLKPEDVRRLVSTYKEAGTVAGSSFSGLKIESGSPIPKIPTAITKAENFSDLTLAWQPYDKAALNMLHTTATIKQYVPFLLMAKNAKWEQAEDGIRVTYDGGAVKLLTGTKVRVEDLRIQTQLFNSLSNSAQIISHGVWKSPIDSAPRDLKGRSVPKPASPTPLVPSFPQPEGVPLQHAPDITDKMR